MALFSHTQLALGGQLVRNSKEGVLETERSSLTNQSRSQCFLTFFCKRHSASYWMLQFYELTKLFPNKNFCRLRPKSQVHNCAFSAHRSSQAKCHRLQASCIKRINFFLVCRVIKILVTELSRSVLENAALGQDSPKHTFYSVKKSWEQTTIDSR